MKADASIALVRSRVQPSRTPRSIRFRSSAAITRARRSRDRRVHRGRAGVRTRRVGDGVGRGRLPGAGTGAGARSSAPSIRTATARRCARSCTAGRAARISSRCSGSCRRCSSEHGSLERRFAAGVDPAARGCRAALERFSATRARDRSPARRTAARAAIAWRLLFLLAALDRLRLQAPQPVSALDGARATASIPAAGRRSRARQLVVPLDTHTIRVGKCLRLTTRASPGWKMAADITRRCARSIRTIPCATTSRSAT